MNSDQYHLCKIAEEAVEVAQRALKAQQFGLGEVQPGQELNNLNRLVSEFHDLFATFDNFISSMDQNFQTIPEDAVYKARLKKMEKFLTLSKMLNQVSEDTTV